MKTAFPTEPSLLAEIAELRARLAVAEEAQETLRAIYSGEVEALVVPSPNGPRVFTPQGLDPESNRFRGEILAQVSDAVIAVDNELRVTYLNAAAERPYGVVAAEVLGHCLDELDDFRWVRPEDAAASEAALRETGQWRGENIYVKRNGESIQVESSVSCLHAEDGTQTGLLAVIRDITERKRAEEALRFAHERIDTILQTMSDGFAAFDHEWRYTHVNPAAAEAFKTTPEQLLGKTIWEMWPPAYDLPVGVNFRRSVEENIPLRFECYYPAPLDRWFEARCQPTSEGLATFFTDITERKRAEDALRESERRERERAGELAVMLELVPTPVIIVHDPDANHMTGNRAADELLRIPRNTELSLSASAETRPSHFRALKAGRELRLDELPAQRAARGEHVKDFEFTLAFDDGTVRHLLGYGTPLLDDEGCPRGAVHTLVDITERKQAEEALRVAKNEAERSEAELAALLDAVPALVFIAHDAQCRKISGSRVAQELLGLPATANFSKSAPLGESSSNFRIMRNDREIPVEQLPVQMAACGQAVRGYECDLVFEDGSIRTILGDAVPLLDESGHPRGAIGAFIDITEKRDAEERIKGSLHEKEALLKEIHHRVKNNMQVISSLVNLQADALKDPAMRELFQDVRDRVRSMAMVHEKLYQSDSLASVEFAEYTRSLMHYLWRAHGSVASGIRLNFDLQPVSVPIEMAVPCALILNELTVNALKHAFRDRSSGEVTVTLCTGPDGRVCLRLRDDGVGLPPGADWRQSPSLGLRLVQMLASQLKGTVETGPGLGTEFVLTFGPLVTQ